MKYLKFLIIGFVLASSCDSKLPKPDNLISEEKMADILTDLALINAGQGLNKRTLSENGITPEKYVYEKYDIDSLQFALSNNYYAFHIKKYERIYKKLKANLTDQKVAYKKIEAQEKKEKKTNDSLARIRKRTLKDSMTTMEHPKVPLIKTKVKGLLEKADLPLQSKQ